MKKTVKFIIDFMMVNRPERSGDLVTNLLLPQHEEAMIYTQVMDVAGAVAVAAKHFDEKLSLGEAITTVGLLSQVTLYQSDFIETLYLNGAMDDDFDMEAFRKRVTALLNEALLNEQDAELIERVAARRNAQDDE